MRSAPQYQDVIARLFPEYAKKDLSGLTRSITFCVTNACQLRCSYCYEHNKGGDRMSFETAKKFVDLLLREEKGMGLYANKELTPAVVLDFIGGEPLLEFGVVRGNAPAVRGGKRSHAIKSFVARYGGHAR